MLWFFEIWVVWKLLDWLILVELELLVLLLLVGWLAKNASASVS